MTTTNKLMLATALFGVAALTSKAEPPVVPPPPPPVVVTPPPPPPVQVAPVPIPAPGVTVNIGVPDSYAWDGYEYVGIIGNQYFYLGPGNVWMVMPKDRYARFYAWQRDHQDWRTHAIRNDLYRRDAQGHDHPWPNHNHDGH